MNIDAHEEETPEYYEALKWRALKMECALACQRGFFEVSPFLLSIGEDGLPRAEDSVHNYKEGTAEYYEAKKRQAMGGKVHRTGAFDACPLKARVSWQRQQMVDELGDTCTRRERPYLARAVKEKSPG